MFDPIFMNNLQQVHGDNMSPTKLTNRNYKTHLLQQEKYLLGTNRMEQYSFVRASHKKWLENGSDFDNDEYEWPILKYNANDDTLA
jgi:hypothetical protein